MVHSKMQCTKPSQRCTMDSILAQTLFQSHEQAEPDPRRCTTIIHRYAKSQGNEKYEKSKPNLRPILVLCGHTFATKDVHKFGAQHVKIT